MSYITGIFFWRVMIGLIAILAFLGISELIIMIGKYIYDNPWSALVVFIIPICYFVGKFLENKMDNDTR